MLDNLRMSASAVIVDIEPMEDLMSLRSWINFIKQDDDNISVVVVADVPLVPGARSYVADNGSWF